MNGKFLIQWFIFHKQGCQETAAELEDQEPYNRNNDRYLCCCFDGLFYAVILLRAEIEAFSDGTAQELAERLCSSAKRRRDDNHTDDVTVMVAILNKTV